MLAQRNVLYFTPYYFPDGNLHKNKYFIVLGEMEDNLIIANLPTSKDRVPNYIKKQHGCIEKPEINFNCYFFEKGVSISESGYSFPVNTYMYGEQVTTVSKKTMSGIYREEGKDYEIKCKLSLQEFSSIIRCLKNSKSVKNKIKRMINAIEI
jgi:hypothetical protein